MSAILNTVQGGVEDPVPTVHASSIHCYTAW